MVEDERRAARRPLQEEVEAAAVGKRNRLSHGRRIRPRADPQGREWREPATASLARAIAAMEALLAEARADVSALCRAGERSDWCARATAAAERAVRKSIEMRALALILPAVWPMQRPAR